MNASRIRSTSSNKTARKRATAGGKGSGAERKSPRRATRGKPAASSRTRRTPLAQAIELLMEDHRKVQKLFRQAERAKGKPQQLRAIVEEACAALTQHAAIEERYLYPVLHDTIKERDLVAEAEVEHASAKQLIAQLESGDPEDEQYAATFTVLGEYVNHHIGEEEKQIFPKARRAGGGDYQPLLDALTSRGEPRPKRGARDALDASEEAPTERGSARGRQGRGRSVAREGAGPEASGVTRSAAETIAGDVEQPRRSRRGEALDTGETESTGLTREQEASDEEAPGSRRGR